MTQQNRLQQSLHGQTCRSRQMRPWALRPPSVGAVKLPIMQQNQPQQLRRPDTSVVKVAAAPGSRCLQHRQRRCSSRLRCRQTAC